MEQAMQMLSDRSVKFYEIADAVGMLSAVNIVLLRILLENRSLMKLAKK